MGAVTRELAAVKVAKEGLEQSHSSATAALAVATRQLADTTHQLTDMTAREASRHTAAQAAQTQLVRIVHTWSVLVYFPRSSEVESDHLGRQCNTTDPSRYF